LHHKKNKIMTKLTIKFYLILILFIFLFITAFFTKDAIQTNLLAFSPLVPAKHCAEPCKHCVKNSPASKSPASKSPLVPAKHCAEPCKHCVKNSPLVSFYRPARPCETLRRTLQTLRQKLTPC
jgi:hypothetical protein